MEDTPTTHHIPTVVPPPSSSSRPRDKEMSPGLPLTHEHLQTRPSVTAILSDIPNAISVTGLVLSFMAVVALAHHRLHLGCALALLSTLCDWLDGAVARIPSISGFRHREMAQIGRNMDSLCDVITFGLVPSMLMLEMAEYSLLSYMCAIPYLVLSVIRLSAFTLYGLSGRGFYIGLPLDITSIIANVTLAVLRIMGIQHHWSSISVHIVYMIGILASTSMIETPKITHGPVFQVSVGIIVVTALIHFILSMV